MEKHRPIEEIVTELLKALGQDPETDDNIKDTPKRYAKALQFLTSGYTTCPEEVVGSGIFQEDHDEMVIVKNISFYSLCEHHLLPFCGQVTLFNSSQKDSYWLHS
jgi:GTP cyclohydrolase I